MLSALVLAAVLPLTLPITIDGGDLEQESLFVQCEERERRAQFDAAVMSFACRQAAEQQREVIHGLLVDTARVAGGAFVDLWSTEYALAKCDGCEEGNPLGISPAARRLLKGALVVGSVAGLHKLRRDGHPVWAKWIGRAILALQLGAAANNVVKAHR